MTVASRLRLRGADARIVAALLFVSGGCALIYQLAWLRDLRLVFGYSTAASAAALAIFMGGLGAGAIVLGRRADAHGSPLRFYAQLEAGIAIFAAATLVLLPVVRHVYVAAGGSVQLGLGVATILRLALSAAVLAVPTFLMGATLSAAARAVEVSGEHRWRTALLYGSNTLGAVTGVLLANFVFLEWLGTRITVLLAVAANVVIAALAFSLAQPVAAVRADATTSPAEPAGSLQSFILVVAGGAGFAFLLMEIVWYRMLAPLLRGSTYSFGVILAVALAGVGAGGLLYAAEARRAQSSGAGRLAMVSALEAFCCIIPVAFGDHIALLAMRLHPANTAGFVYLGLSWVAVAAVVVFPMALVAGYQFPLLIGLAGSRAETVGTQVGRVYAINTFGAIVGSLAGGFGVLPTLGALGSWRLATVALSLLGLAGAWVAWTRGERRGWIFGSVIVAVGAVLLCCAPGPTAAWRHRPIGMLELSAAIPSPNAERDYLYGIRRGLIWEEDGVESSVAEISEGAVNLFLNGKSDGNAISDASTMIMIGGLPAIFHEQPKRVLVIGLGLGSTAGFLASLPSVERVDVVELEPAVLRVARDVSSANFGVMNNPKVHIIIGDAREFLLTTRNRYDIIASEPSNPYRAGVASLFTVEFYQAAKAALAPNGIFAQWLQAYSVSLATVRTVYASIGTVFDSVESWEVQLGDDLLLLARARDPQVDAAHLAARVASEPYRTAMHLAWGVTGIDGLYSGFLASSALARDIRTSEPTSRLNTDDRTLVEYECARAGAQAGAVLIEQLRALASQRPEYAPALANGGLDPNAFAEARIARAVHEESEFSPDDLKGSAADRARVEARVAYVRGEFDDARTAWQSQGSAPEHPIDVLLLAHTLAAVGDRAALPLAETLRVTSPGDTDVIAAVYEHANGDIGAATTALARAFHEYRKVPWGYLPLRLRALRLAWVLAETRQESVAPLLESLRERFAVYVQEDQRFYMHASIALDMGPPERCAQAIESIEPWVFWNDEYLDGRAKCYERVHSPYWQRARRDLAEFRAAAGTIASP